MTVAASLVAEVDRAVSDADRRMAFLLHVTPVNVAEACAEFTASADAAPAFEYRPLPFDPRAEAARLAELSELAGDGWAALLRAKRREVVIRLEMLARRGTAQFRELADLLYGGVTKELAALAHQLLDSIPPSGPERASPGVGAAEIARRATAEIAAYRRLLPELDCRVEVRPDVAGMVVEQGNLLIGRDTVVPPERVQALLHHEIGTHVLTHANGGRQPLRLMRDGLAGYEELQEALGVLAEYLSGGLSPPRLRRLAERVAAVASMQVGATFRETYDLLRRRWGLAAGAAFRVAMRAHRAGGLAKDLVYLRGLEGLLAHLGAGRSFDVLFAGKITLRDVAAIERLLAGGGMERSWVAPRYLDDPGAAERFDRLRAGMAVPGLLER